MNLDDKQKQQVIKWLDQGLKLADVQKNLEQEFGLRLTYMEVKFLLSDLNAKPKDPEPEQPVTPPATASAADDPGGPDDDFSEDELPGDAGLPPAGTGGVRLAVDQIARPGAMISGKVTFANGKTCEWMLDQMGRLGVVPAEDGYKPAAAELRDFQIALQGELQRMGF